MANQTRIQVAISLLPILYNRWSIFLNSWPYMHTSGDGNPESGLVKFQRIQTITTSVPGICAISFIVP